MKHVPRLILFAMIAACLAFAMSCAALRKAVWTATGAAAGAAVGLLAGPPGAIGGAAVGAVAVNVVAENDELRSGKLIGKEAAETIYVDREVVRELWSIPWGKIALWGGLFLFWLKGHHLIAFLRGNGIGRLTNVVLPSWAQKAKS